MLHLAEQLGVNVPVANTNDQTIEELELDSLDWYVAVVLLEELGCQVDERALESARGTRDLYQLYLQSVPVTES